MGFEHCLTYVTDFELGRSNSCLARWAAIGRFLLFANGRYGSEAAVGRLRNQEQLTIIGNSVLLVASDRTLKRR